MAGSYDLGIDVGTMLTTAAARRGDGSLALVGLGARSDRIPTVVYLDDESRIVVGEAAARLAGADPSRASWDLKRRLGDPAPLILGSSPFAAEALLARVIAHVVARTSEVEGGGPRHTAVAHPTSWDPYRVDLAGQALRRAGLEDCSLVTEAQAAVEAFALRTSVPVGAPVAVYALGGARFEATVVRGGPAGFDVLASEALTDVSGDVVDGIVLRLVRERLGDQWPEGTDPAVLAGLAQLRREVTDAKELLSLEEEVAVPILLPRVQRQVTVRRTDVESALRPLLLRSVAALEEQLGAARVDPATLAAVLPVGGATRMPLVVTVLRQRFGDRVVTDTDPSTLVARGASVAAGRAAAPAPTPTAATVTPAPAPAPAPPPAGRAPTVPAATVVEPGVGGEPPAWNPPGSTSAGSGRGGPSNRLPVLVGVGLLAVLVGVGAFLLTRDDGDDGTDVVTQPLDSLPGEDQEEPDQAPSGDGMVAVPAGTYTIGAERPESNSAETLARTTDVAGFHIDAHEVTNVQYRAFLEQTGAPAPSTWSLGAYPEGEADFPVSGVTYDWAAAYCQSLDKRLPTEIEWEVAARGPDGLLYPWGDDVTLVSLPDAGTYAVGSVTGNVSPLGVYDLAGNVWEWVADSYDERVGAEQRVLRGGQNGYLRKNVTRLPVDPLGSSAVEIAGFRCAASTVDPERAPLEFGDFEVPETPATVEPEPLPEGVLVADRFQDPTSGWVEESTDTYRFGYHPNEYYHLENKVPDQEVLALGPVSTEPGRPVRITTSAFVDPNLSEVDSGFSYGLAYNMAQDGSGLIFVANPGANEWLVCERAAGGGYVVLERGTRAFDDIVELSVDLLGFDRYEFRIDGNLVHTRAIPNMTGNRTGFVLLSGPDASKVHIHFDEFDVRDIA